MYKHVLNAHGVGITASSKAIMSGLVEKCLVRVFIFCDCALGFGVDE